MSVRSDSFIQFGPHASAADITLETGTKYFLRPRNKSNWHGAKYRDLSRADYQTGTGAKIPSLKGPLDLGTLPQLQMHLRGLASGGAGDGVVTTGITPALRQLLLLALGGGEYPQTGELTHASDAGTGTTVTLSAAPIGTAANRAWLFRGTTSGTYAPRFQITYANAADVVVCRALTTATGSADTALEAVVAYAGHVFLVSPDTPNRVPQFIDVEDDAQRDVYRGVYVSRLTLTLAPGELLTADFDLVYSDGTPAGSLQSPTYSAPTDGNEIKVWDSPVWIGSTQVMPVGTTTVVVENTLQKRGGGDSQGGPQGNYGYVVVDTNVTCETTIGFGSLSLEQARSYVTTLQAEGTIDVLVAAGRTPGAAAAIRLPELDVNAEIVDVAGVKAIKIMGTATGATPMQLAVY